MIRFSSIKEWKNYCFATHKNYLRNKYFMCWSKKKNVNVFNYALLREEDVNQIKKSIENALRLCNNDFKISMFKRRFNELDFAVKSGNIIGRKILDMVKKSRIKKKSCNAEIFLVNRKAKSGKVLLKYGDALTYVSDGVIIFTFDPSIKYPKRFFRDTVAHEVYHLLGLNMHHNDAEVNGYEKLSRCIMEYNASSGQLCRKCRDGLNSFLEGVKYASE